MLCIIQNDPQVPPGNLIDFLHIPYIIYQPYQGEALPEIEQISALIVLGGAMGANDDERYPFLTELKSLIHTVVSSRIPYLGICLGGQLLAAALGAEVVANRWEEIGTMNIGLSDEGKADSLFRGIPSEFATFQWHHDSFDLPDGGALLASSAACPNQAFRVGDSVWGLQFHPEVTAQIIRDWCAWDPTTSEKTNELLVSFEAFIENYNRTSQQIISNFLTVDQLHRTKKQS